MTWILGEPTCCTTLPNACSYEEFDGCNGRWIHSCTKQSWGGDKKWTEGALFACVVWVYSYDLTLQYVVNYLIPHPLCICYENIEAPWCYQMCCLYELGQTKHAAGYTLVGSNYTKFEHFKEYSIYNGLGHHIKCLILSTSSFFSQRSFKEHNKFAYHSLVLTDLLQLWYY